MIIVVDAMGGDHAPAEIVKASVQAAEDFDIQIILVGKQDIIKKELEQYKYNPDRITVHHAEEVVTNDDSPTRVIKTKKDSSMVVGFRLLKEGKGDAFVSAGSTGALLTGALLMIGRIKGVDRPALTPVLPTDKGCAVLVDAGANTNCKPENFLQFGIMGSAYMKKVIGVSKPRVGLVNVGTEEGKGTDIIKSSYALLENAPIHFVGNIEAREIPEGDVDVIVCDGFVGNVILKLIEGMGMTFYANIKELFTKNIFTKLAALLVKGGLKDFKKKMNYEEYGGAPFLGIDGVVIKAHGSSKAQAFYSAIRQTKVFVETGVIDEIKEYISKRGVDESESVQ